MRLDYIDSIKCLMALPSEGNDLWPGAKSRYDDFQGMHIYMTKQVHFNGPFLPRWHRWMLYLFESELRTKCDFKGTLPYWDMGLDNTAEGFAKSPVFDNIYGVGGNGPYIADVTDPEEFPVQKPIEIPERSGCVQEGPFANITVPMGLGYSVEYTPHCLRRDFSLPIITSALSDEVINRTLSATSFDEFNLHIQGYSMQVADMYSSPGDPIFYFIHGALDKIWNEWQRMDWPARKMDIGGPDIIWAYPFNFFGDVAYENITLQYPSDSIKENLSQSRCLSSFFTMSYTLEERQRVYRTCRAIFSGDAALFRKPKKIKETLLQNRGSLQHVFQEFDEVKLADIVKELLENRLFESDLRAKVEFPELFRTSPQQDAQREASEADAAKSVADCLGEIARFEEEEEIPEEKDLEFLTRPLKDEVSIKAQLEELKSELDNKIKAMEMSKNVLEDRAAAGLEEIRRQREELDRQEKQLVLDMLTEDREYKDLVGKLLVASVKDIFEDRTDDGMGKEAEHVNGEVHINSAKLSSADESEDDPDLYLQ
ncbi:N-acetyl-6-hydroxytryptophan oxidase ivoB [Colletotrichum sp. SAR 10_99]|nr:N-acetyl-6-hydroxytryptophan oxidase ivoB [Colletotrichum sp. SAR 10_99]